MRARLTEWRCPSELKTLLDDINRPHGFYSAGQGAMQPWREAFCANEFAMAVDASAVRLGEDPPDFYLRLGVAELAFELTEVRNPATKMGAEFDALAALANDGRKLPLEHFDPTEALNEVACWIEDVVARKARKSYAKGTILAVRVHVMMFDSMSEAVLVSIERKIRDHIPAFREIWMLVGSEFIIYR